MTPKQRLTAVLQGKSVDRVPLNLYETGGLPVNPEDPDEFNVYNDPSWKPLLELAYHETDIIKMAGSGKAECPEIYGLDATNPDVSQIAGMESCIQDDCLFNRISININGRVLSSLTKRNKEVDTVWVIEPLLKDTEDLKAYLTLPDAYFSDHVDVDKLYAEEKRLGEQGIVMVEMADPICQAASLFSMEDFTVIALTEKRLFHQLLEKLSLPLYRKTETIAAGFPGRLWRIFGPEYATEPYLPPNLFKEYVVGYTGPMTQLIKKYTGYVRIHSHGRIKNNLNSIVQDLNADAIDPVEAPPSGDVSLKDVKEQYAGQVVIFGNIQISDIENRDPKPFKDLVKKTIEDGMAYTNKGFVLMPTASPFGRHISKTTMKNYESMVQLCRAAC